MGHSGKCVKRYLKDKVDRRRYNNAWRVYFIIGPFLGALFGAVTYFLIIGGLLSLSGGTQTKIVNPLIIIPAAFLAAYNWQWGAGLFDRIGAAFGGNTDKKEANSSKRILRELSIFIPIQPHLDVHQAHLHGEV